MKRKLSIIIYILAAIILIGGYIFLNSPFFEERVRRFAQSKIQEQLGREVHVGKVTGNILGSISIDGLSVAKYEKLSEGKLLEIKEITTSYSLFSLVRWRFVIDSIRIYEPRIWIERDKQGNLNLPQLAQQESTQEEDDGSSFAVIISDLRVVSGEVNFDDKPTGAHAKLTGLNGRLENTGGKMDYFANFRVQKLDADFQGKSKSIFNISTSLETSDIGVKVHDLRMELGRSNLSITGNLINTGANPEVDFNLLSRFYLGDVKEFVPQLERIEGKGKIKASVQG
ncbi:AsmA family protein, partial [Candidatus Poribacteria bacterium]|nr:AsmA family protein [Candidatus Poribacteria bacterium]